MSHKHSETPDYDEGEYYDERDDKEKAFECFMRGAEKNEPVAINALASCYDYGDGVKQNKAEAAALYKMSAELGFATAQFNYARCLENGEGVEKDEEAALEWYKKAAENGDWFAQTLLESKKSNK